MSRQFRSIRSCVVAGICVLLLIYGYNSGSYYVDRLARTHNTAVQIKKIFLLNAKERSNKNAPRIMSPKHIEARFLERYRTAKRACRTLEEVSKSESGQIDDNNRRFGTPLGGRDWPDRFYHQPYALDRLTWCMTAKCGSSYTRFLDEILESNTTEIKEPGVREGERKEFMVVRDPYMRLISGYVDKFVVDKTFFEEEKKYILSYYRPNASQKKIDCAVDISFPEFVKYFLQSQKSGYLSDYHFDPMTMHCDPCQSDIQFIVHLDTYHEDMSYILGTVNASSFKFPEAEDTAVIRRKIYNTMEVNWWKNCLSLKDHYSRLWWAFQVRGYISKHLKFDLTEEQSRDLSIEEVTKYFLDAHFESLGTFDKHKQKREMMAEIFLQAPLDDRIKVRDYLTKDFICFGYDNQPSDLFPELEYR